jgi:uncharacterized protein (TIGR02569 family)
MHRGVGAPSETVLEAFGVAGPSAPLPGGRGTSWRAGELVLKPLDMHEEELVWQAGVLRSILCRGFRVARPRPARDGAWVVEGWCATEWVAGEHSAGRWTDIISVGELLHTELAGVRRPSFLDRRTDPWSIGDRVAWGELPGDRFQYVVHLPDLLPLLRPVAAPSQLIHGDLTGNVLFAPGMAPAIIDLAPYWRPTAFAAAIVVADALCWEGADDQLLAAVSHIEDFGQYLSRALIYRLVTDGVFHGGRALPDERASAYLPAVELTRRLAATSA